MHFGGGIDASLPYRFLITLMHFASTLLIFYSKDIYIHAAGVEEAGQVHTTANWTIMTTLAAATICFLVEFVGLFSGLGIFYPGLNVLYSAAHTSGFVLTLWFISEGWAYQSLVYVFLLFSFIPAVIEGAAMAYHVIIRMKVLQRTLETVQITR